MIRLEKFNKQDYDRLISWAISEEFMIQFSGPLFNYPLTHEELDFYSSAKNRLIFRVVDCESGNVIGHAEINNIDHINKNARLCRILVGDPECRNKGFGKLIIKELVRIGFSELRLHRLDLGVFDFNSQAIKCYKDCGFEIEGLLRDTTRIGDEYWSIYNMSILSGVEK
jgi:RimJ/RimL family protein N-acetyltransferase